VPRCQILNECLRHERGLEHPLHGRRCAHGRGSSAGAPGRRGLRRESGGRGNRGRPSRGVGAPACCSSGREFAESRAPRLSSMSRGSSTSTTRLPGLRKTAADRCSRWTS
jgi:hypothetical protein